MKKVDCILTSDWHLREDTPICRTDNFWGNQWEKVSFVCKLQRKYNCPVLHAGDLYHHWKPSPYLLSMTLQHLPKDFHTVYGQHDLPQHSLELTEKCGTNVLANAKVLNILPNASWGQTPDEFCQYSFHTNHTILVWHTQVYKNKSPYIGKSVNSAKALLKKYPQYDLIVIGDNHQTFVEEYKGRLLVNPGSLTRQTADQIDHKPCVFLWYAETNTVKQVFLPIEENAVSRTHLDKIEERDNRINAFIAGLDTTFEMGISFESNLEKFYENNIVDEEVKCIIKKCTTNETSKTQENE